MIASSISHPAVVAAGVPARGLNFFLAGRRAQGRIGFVPVARVTSFRLALCPIGRKSVRLGQPLRDATRSAPIWPPLTLLPRACRRRGDCPSERFLLPRLGGPTDGRVAPPRTLPSFLPRVASFRLCPIAPEKARSFNRIDCAAEAGEGGSHLGSQRDFHGRESYRGGIVAVTGHGIGALTHHPSPARADRPQGRPIRQPLGVPYAG
jgi:hypothetical protein